MELAITFVALVGAIGIFLLSEYKDVIWDKSEFEDDDE